MKRNSLRALVCALLASLVLTTFAFADSGPKPQLTVRVEIAPQEPYYLDLLAEGDWNESGESSYDGVDWSYHGKEDTLVTIQIDMLLAERFGMYYVDENGEKKLPYIIHRTSLGCYERTLAYLIEEYAGALPTWMAPEQVRFLPVTDRAADYCAEQARKLEDMGFRVEVDYRNEKIGRKIRDAQMEKVPYMLVVGDRDMENGTVSPRHRADGDLGAMSMDEFSALLKQVVDNKEKK